MISKGWIMCFLIVAPLFFTTGCWDRRELNERAFAIATGLDLADDGSVIQSYQFALPGKLGGPNQGKGEKAYAFFETKGKTLQDARQKTQAELSRGVFLGQRRAILVGEKMAQHGLKNMLDVYSRNPEVRVRTDMFVIQGGDAKDELQKDYPFERLPALAALRIHKEIGGHPGDTAFRDFLMDATSDSTCPTLLSMSNNKVTGRAIFNRDLHLVGYLVKNEAADRLWLTGGITHFIYTVYIPKGHGNVSYDIHKFRHQVTPIIHGQDVSFHVSVYGLADVKENDSSLDLSKSENVQLLEKAYEQYEETEINNMVQRVQTQYGTDIFRFGEAVHRRYPVQWNKLKKNWSQEFPKAKVTVEVHIKIQRTGLTGAPLQLSTHLGSGALIGGSKSDEDFS